MFCTQLKIYLGYLVAQLVLSLFAFGSQKIHVGLSELLGPVLFSVFLNYLCQQGHNELANVLVGLVLVLGVGVDLAVFNKKK